MAYKTAWSEKQEVGIATELLRKNSEVAEDSAEGKEVKMGEREFQTTLSMIIALCNSHFSDWWCMGWGGWSSFKGPVASGVGSDSLSFTILHLLIISLRSTYGFDERKGSTRASHFIKLLLSPITAERR